MKDLKRMIIFTHVVEALSFSEAAKRLGIAKSAVSNHISQLEKCIGVRLINRSTRQLSLTEEGMLYYESCADIVSRVEEATRRVTQLQKEPLGTLKITCPIGLGQSHIIPLLSEFMNVCPSLKVDLQLDDKIVNMIDERIDISIRVGWPGDSSLVARKLFNSPRVLCASPGYIERFGMPQTPEELSNHNAIIFTLLPTPYRWTFHKGQNEKTIHVNGSIKTNSSSAVYSLLMEGVGIAPISYFLVSEEIKSGKLIPLLTDQEVESVSVHAVYQSRHYPSPKVRLFIDFMIEQIKNNKNLDIINNSNCRDCIPENLTITNTVPEIALSEQT